MTWEREMTEIVRVLIGDMDTTQKYSDERIERCLLVSAYQVIQEVDFDITYTVSISQSSIDPSPVPCDSTSDVGLVNLATLKAAMLILQGESRVAAYNSIKVTDGPSTIETKGRYDAIKGMLDYLKAEYEAAKMDYVLGTVCPIQAVLTPTTNSNIPPGMFGSNMESYYNLRDRSY